MTAPVEVSSPVTEGMPNAWLTRTVVLLSRSSRKVSDVPLVSVCPAKRLVARLSTLDVSLRLGRRTSTERPIVKSSLDLTMIPGLLVVV
jgi:hypothetical protein